MVSTHIWSEILPIFTLNESAGNWLEQNYNYITVNFHKEQTYLVENPNQEHGAIGSNVMGNITIDNDSEAPSIVISNRYDGMWGQTPGDSGVSTAIVLGMAKYYAYLRDHGGLPKYNLQFVFTTGEEYYLKGAKYFNDSHPNYNIKDWFIAEQCGFDQIDTTMGLYVNNSTTDFSSKVAKQIINDSKYKSKTGYEIENFSNWASGSEQKIVSTRPGITTFCLSKDVDSIWEGWHATGNNYTEGDCLNRTDRNDVNVTTDLFWNLLKYFTINPDCIFDGPVNYTRTDSIHDPDNIIDSITATMPLKSILPQDKVRIVALLKNEQNQTMARKEKDFIISNVTSNREIEVTLPPDSPVGNYSLLLYLYNSTGRINVILWPLTNNHPNDVDNSTNLPLSPRGNAPPATPTEPDGPWLIPQYIPGEWSSTSMDPNADRIGQRWFWDDYNPVDYGYTDTGLHAVDSYTLLHAYSTVGTHHIRVKAYDEYSTLLHPYESDFSDYHDVTVAPWGKIFAPQQLHPEIIDTVQGYNLQLYAVQSGGQNVQWNWDFGDNTKSGSSTQNPTHTYTNPPEEPILLTISDGVTQLNGTASATVRFLDLDSDFNLSYYHSAKPDTNITFSDRSKTQQDKTIENWSWNFSDGTYAYTPGVTHSFPIDGDYNVTLTVKDSDDNTNTDYTIIHVTSTPRKPEISYVQDPQYILPGSNATIIAQITPTDNNVTQVTINITTPNGTTQNHIMTQVIDNVYTYTLENITQSGLYNYTIYALDIDIQTNSSSGSFTLLQPYITFVPPTPETNTTLTQNIVHVNTSILDPYPTAAFINWNSSLKGYWSMDIYNGTYLYDTSPYQNIGTYHNGINSSSITTGKFGNGLNLETNGGYIDLGDDTSLNFGTSDFTFTAWIKNHTPSYPGTAVILSNQPENANWNGYMFGITNTPYLATITNGQNTSLSGTINVTDDSWHHLAYIRDGNTLRLYVDGTSDGEINGTIRNITNDQTTCISKTDYPGWCQFDGILDEAMLFNRALTRDELNTTITSTTHPPNHTYTGLPDGNYTFSAYCIDTTGNQSTTETRQVQIINAPQFTNVTATPSIVGFGENVTIQANVIDAMNDVTLVKVQVFYPNTTCIWLNMTNTGNNTYQLIFNDTWTTGQYQYYVWAEDSVENTNTTSYGYFSVDAHALINITTLKGDYSGEEYIELTDPPSPTQNYTLTGRGLTWNKYYDATSGYDVLETYAGPVNYQNENNTWTPIKQNITLLTSNDPAYSYGYRAGNDRGLYNAYFKPNLQNNWPVAFAYNKSQNPTIDILRTKLLGVGYLDPSQNWNHVILQNVLNSQGQLQNNTITYPGAFTGTDVIYRYQSTMLKENIQLGNAAKSMLLTHPPSSYGLNTETSYLVFVTKLDPLALHLFNASDEITGNITIENGRLSFKDAAGVFKCAMPIDDAYELQNSSHRLPLKCRIIKLGGEWYLLSGCKYTDLMSLQFPVIIDPSLTVDSSSSDGYLHHSEENYIDTWQATSENGISWTPCYDIFIGQSKVSQTYTINRGYVYFNTSMLPSNMIIHNVTLSLYNAGDNSDTDFNIRVQSGQPDYPKDPLDSTDYNKAYYSNISGTLNTTDLVEGYNDINLINPNNEEWINLSHWTKLCLRSSRDICALQPTGDEYVDFFSSEQGADFAPRLVIVHENQSKIKNTGTTNLSGYLSIQVQFYDPQSKEWILDVDAVNETSPRMIEPGQQLALDQIFNGFVRACDLTHGDGLYRVYAAFRDPEGNILVDSDQNLLAASWQFTVVK